MDAKRDAADWPCRFYDMCRKVGAKPERCYGESVKRPTRKSKRNKSGGPSMIGEGRKAVDKDKPALCDEAEIVINPGEVESPDVVTVSEADESRVDAH